MVYAIPEEVRQRVRAHLQLGQDPQTVADGTRVSKRTVHRIRSNLIHHGTTRKPKQDVQGRRRAINANMEQVCPICAVYELTRIRHS